MTIMYEIYFKKLIKYFKTIPPLHIVFSLYNTLLKSFPNIQDP